MSEDKKLSAGDRAADIVRKSLGSWKFVLSFLAFMIVWVVANGNHGIDPYPYILLNLFLSMVAGLQGAILLISARREDAISDSVAGHTLDNTDEIRELIEANTALTETLSVLVQKIDDYLPFEEDKDSDGFS